MRATAGKSSVTYATLSNTIVLVLIGFFSLLYLHTNSITNLVKEKINILVELNPDSLNNRPDALIKLIQSNPKVVPGSVKFIPKSEADKVLGIEISENLKKVGSPFKDIVSFNVKAEHYREENLSKIKKELKGRPEIFDVFFENVVVENIKSNLRNVSYVVLLLSLIFVFLAVIIIYNTINLSLYADRWEIKTMEIIGARDKFIRQPYIKIAGNIALKSFFIAALILLAGVAFIIYNFEGMSDIIKWYFIGLSLLLMFIISLVITVTATVSIVNKYLYKKESELY
jgi:cell division transport system permease protein